MAGRLRVKWASLHTDEVYFRTHGLLAWSVSSMPVAATVSSVISKMTSAAVDAGAGAGVVKTTLASGAAATAAAAKEAADTDCEAASATALWLTVAMLIGAVIASVSQR